MADSRRPTYSEKTQSTCPRCASSAILALPANNPGSGQEWFRCGACDHMWSQRRDRTAQGDRLVPIPPEREGNGA